MRSRNRRVANKPRIAAAMVLGTIVLSVRDVGQRENTESSAITVIRAIQSAEAAYTPVSGGDYRLR